MARFEQVELFEGAVEVWAAGIGDPAVGWVVLFEIGVGVG